MRNIWMANVGSTCVKLALAISLLVASMGTESWADETSAEAIPAGLALQGVSILPARLELTHPWDVAQVLIVGHLDSGQQIDLTRMAELKSESTVVEVSPRGQVTPLADGRQTLTFEVAGHSVQLDAVVNGFSTGPEVSYVRDVSPGLSKMGCNAGTCHGAKDGQRGFKLSLRGYDFEYDHRALTDDIGSRRFNRANPDQSLMLLKASGSIPHVGGALTQPGDRRYEVLRRWIANGAKLDLEAPRVSSIELLPKNPMLPRTDLSQQMIVLATYADGSVRDVTADAFIESGNIEVLAADKSGLVTTLRRGEAPILARYEGAYTATTITVMGDRSGFVWSDPPTFNYVDELVYDKLQRVKILPSEVCTDETFIRRIYLDLTGLIPTADDVRRFVSDDRPTQEKRNELIDQLLGNPDYVEHWTNKWADLLQVNRKYLGEVGATALRSWIQDAVAGNKPYNEFAYEVLTASGSTLENPAAAYWKVLREPSAAMENTTHLFLSVRFNCNKCHDHPFERWTQDQYYHMTAFFAQVGRKEDADFAGERIRGSAVESSQPLVEVVYDSNKGETTHERTGQVAPPAVPYGTLDAATQDDSRREQLARWITSEDNRYFASSYVNRLWGYLLGVGLIEPIDDIRAGNPPTNPPLLQALTEDFVTSGFDVQHMLRAICRSRTYQHAIDTNSWNEGDTINFSHALPRRLPAEVLFDVIHQATGSKTHIGGLPVGLRAAQLPDAGVSLPFLDDFGRPPRESACECERTSGVVLGPIMKLINGPTVNDALVDPNNALAELVATRSDDRELIEEVFLRFLGRRPTDEELAVGVTSLTAARGDAQVARDRLEAYRGQLSERVDAWEAGLPRPANWTVMHPSQMKSSAGAVLQDDESGVISVTGTLAEDTYEVVLASPLRRITGARLEALPSETLPGGGPGRAGNGNFVINDFQLLIGSMAELDKATVVPLKNAVADFSQKSWDVAGAIDDKQESGWAIMPKVGQPHEASFEAATDLAVSPDQVLVFKIQHKYADGRHNLGKFRLAVTDSDRPLTGPQLPSEILTIVTTDRDDRTPEQQDQLQKYFLTQDSQYQKLTRSLETAETQTAHHRLTGLQDFAWALINTPAFLFNR